MYQKGDYVVYGTKGVCLIEDVTMLDWGADCISSEKLCYKLTPRFVKGSTIYAPVENEKTVIRSVMSREEAQAGDALGKRRKGARGKLPQGTAQRQQHGMVENR